MSKHKRIPDMFYSLTGLSRRWTNQSWSEASFTASRGLFLHGKTILTSPACRWVPRQEWTHQAARSPGSKNRARRWRHRSVRWNRKCGIGLNSTHILMLHVLEQPELPVGPLSKDLWLERPVELLNGHFLISLLIYRWAVVNNGTPSHYCCTHTLFAIVTISLFRSREKT